MLRAELVIDAGRKRDLPGIVPDLLVRIGGKIIVQDPVIDTDAVSRCGKRAAQVCLPSQNDFMGKPDSSHICLAFPIDPVIFINPFIYVFFGFLAGKIGRANPPEGENPGFPGRELGFERQVLVTDQCRIFRQDRSQYGE
jgi:hypothetical protein